MNSHSFGYFTRAEERVESTATFDSTLVASASMKGTKRRNIKLLIFRQ
jgi:hypothetical protein